MRQRKEFSDNSDMIVKISQVESWVNDIYFFCEEITASHSLIYIYLYYRLFSCTQTLFQSNSKF